MLQGQDRGGLSVACNGTVVAGWRLAGTLGSVTCRKTVVAQHLSPPMGSWVRQGFLACHQLCCSVNHICLSDVEEMTEIY